MDTKTVYLYSIDGAFSGSLILNETDKSPSGAWNIPANCTEVVPPAFDVEKQTCKWQGEWVVSDIPQPTPEPEPTAKEKQQQQLQQIHAKYNSIIASLAAKASPDQAIAVAKIRAQWQAEIKAVMGL